MRKWMDDRREHIGFGGMKSGGKTLMHATKLHYDIGILPLSHIEKRVMVVLRRRWRYGGYNSWRGFDELSKEINRPVQLVRKTVRQMAKKGIVKHSVGVDTDGVPCGSGYFLTALWDMT